MDPAQMDIIGNVVLFAIIGAAYAYYTLRFRHRKSHVIG
jgi:hypothetical protein